MTRLTKRVKVEGYNLPLPPSEAQRVENERTEGTRIRRIYRRRSG